MSNTTPISKIEENVVIKNIVLEGVKLLRAKRIKTVYDVVSKEMLEKKVETLSFPLTEVTPDTLSDYRKNGVPSFVLKVEGRLYHSRIPNNISFLSSNILGSHKCAVAGHECNRLSADSDEKGGCEKVRNRSNYIERYPWITTGYETFNTKHDSFFVVNCLHYEECPPKKHRTAAEINATRLALAQHVWDDVETLAEVRRRKEKRRITGR